MYFPGCHSLRALRRSKSSTMINPTARTTARLKVSTCPLFNQMSAAIYIPTQSDSLTIVPKLTGDFVLSRRLISPTTGDVVPVTATTTAQKKSHRWLRVGFVCVIRKTIPAHPEVPNKIAKGRMFPMVGACRSFINSILT